MLPHNKQQLRAHLLCLLLLFQGRCRSIPCTAGSFKQLATPPLQLATLLLKPLNQREPVASERAGRSVLESAISGTRLLAQAAVTPGGIVGKQHWARPAHSPAVAIRFQLVHGAGVQTQRLAHQLALQGTTGRVACKIARLGGWEHDGGARSQWEKLRGDVSMVWMANGSPDPSTIDKSPKNALPRSSVSCCPGPWLL